MSFDVIEKHQDDSDNLFLVEEIKNMRNFLDQVESVIFKCGNSKMMVRNNPKETNNVICNLMVLNCLFL